MCFSRLIRNISNHKKNMSSTYHHPRPYVAVDCVAFCFVPSSSTDPLGSLRILLKYRREEGCWGLPGKFLISAEREKLKEPKVDDKNNPEEEARLFHDRYSAEEIERYSNEENEYGPKAETIAQCFRRALEVELAPTIYNKKVVYHLSENYNGKVSTGLSSERNFREDEFWVQLPIRSEVDRDKDREKDGKHPNYRVISIPILHLCSPKQVREPNQSDMSQWIPLSWAIEDNLTDPEIRKLFDFQNGAAANWKLYPRDPQLSEYNYNYKLAFDHPAILASGLRELRKLIRCQGLGRELLPARFKLTDYQRLYEEILGGRLDPTSFRKTMMERGKTVDPSYIDKNLVLATNESYTNQAGRKSNWLCFNDKVYDGYRDRLDFNFSLQLI